MVKKLSFPSTVLTILKAIPCQMCIYWFNNMDFQFCQPKFGALPVLHYYPNNTSCFFYCSCFFNFSCCICYSAPCIATSTAPARPSPKTYPPSMPPFWPSQPFPWHTFPQPVPFKDILKYVYCAVLFTIISCRLFMDYRCELLFCFISVTIGFNLRCLLWR